MTKKTKNPFIFALNGIQETFRTERNFKIHVVVTLGAVALASALSISRLEWLWVLLCIAFVLVAELFNTAIEALTDLVSPRYHLLARKAKDAAAGAVLLAVFFAVAVGAIIFGPKLWIQLFP